VIKAKVYVTLRPSVFDPQSKVIDNTLHSLGYDNIKEVKASKYFELTFDGTDEEFVRKQLTEICKKVLSNTNTENFSFELEILK